MTPKKANPEGGQANGVQANQLAQRNAEADFPTVNRQRQAPITRCVALARQIEQRQQFMLAMARAAGGAV